MILFDPEKAAHLMRRWELDLLLPHTLLNAGYIADHWYHLVYTTVGPYTTFDVDETYQIFVGLPRDRTMEPFITCRRGVECASQPGHFRKPENAAGIRNRSPPNRRAAFRGAEWQKNCEVDTIAGSAIRRRGELSECQS